MRKLGVFNFFRSKPPAQTQTGLSTVVKNRPQPEHRPIGVERPYQDKATLLDYTRGELPDRIASGILGPLLGTTTVTAPLAALLTSSTGLTSPSEEKIEAYKNEHGGEEPGFGMKYQDAYGKLLLPLMAARAAQGVVAPNFFSVLRERNTGRTGKTIHDPMGGLFGGPPSMRFEGNDEIQAKVLRNAGVNPSKIVDANRPRPIKKEPPQQQPSKPERIVDTTAKVSFLRKLGHLFRG